VILQRIESHVEVSIMDTGEGIAPESLPYIFNRFQQADASTTRRHGGLGLGLAIVKQLVELHGGTAQAQSDGPGKGATFVVSLPLAPLHGLPPTQEARSWRSKSRELPFFPEVSLAGVRILVIDDDADSRDVIKSLLEPAGATVYLAESAEEGMRLFFGKTVDVLICDIGMPDIDGYSLMRSIRMLDDVQKSEIPAVALTAYARLEDRREAIRAGFQNHLPKPVEPSELLETVYSLATRRSRRPAS
jgi:CheY-like chemotaxis protein